MASQALASAVAGDRPLSGLVALVTAQRALAIEAGAANERLGALTKAVLESHPDLAEQLARFGWRTTWTATVDLQGLGSCLQKYMYERLGELGKGSYGVVFKARNRETGEILAIKKLAHNAHTDAKGVPDSTAREIGILRELHHKHIIQLKDIISTVNSAHVYLVLECMDCDLRQYLDKNPDAQKRSVVKTIIWQVLQAVAHMRANLVIHRDLKPQNILVDARRGIIKLTDFGLARQFLPPYKAHAEKVVTLYYRAPELLLGCEQYSDSIDMWSVGVIMAELFNFHPLFKADSEIGLLLAMFEVLGTPTEAVWPGLSNLALWNPQLPSWRPKPWSSVVPALANDPQGQHLLSCLLSYDPAQRLTAKQALAHPWFADVQPTFPTRCAGAGAGSAVASAPAASTATTHIHPAVQGGGPLLAQQPVLVA